MEGGERNSARVKKRRGRQEKGEIGKKVEGRKQVTGG